MKLSQMFPSRYLQAEDLPPNQNTIVTIEKVYPAAARDRGGDSEPEVKWMLRFREFRKPMSLWRNTAKSIEQVLGSDDSDRWIGQQIAIYPSTYVSFGETKPCINVDKWRPEQVAPRAAASGGMVIAGDRRPIPKAAMDRFQAHLKQHGKSWDDFLRWCKGHAPDAIALAWGVELDAIPAGVLPAMKAFLDSIAPPAAAPARELVDAGTGEVLQSPPARPAATVAASPRPVADQAVPDDDIPF